jgi:putative SOS response-associated peptidase YedK
MCGRYDTLIAREAYRSMFKAMRLPNWNFPPRYNVAPTDKVPIVRIDPRDGTREMALARWGLVPFWMKEFAEDSTHQCAEGTVDKLPMFREAFEKRRCLIPATGFFEWEKRADRKQPWRFTREDGEPFAFAGLWEFAKIGGEELLSTTIIVGEPNPLTAAIHDRMPVMLMPNDYDRSLDNALPKAELKALLKPYDEKLMKAYAVSRLTNSVKNEVPGGDRTGSVRTPTTEWVDAAASMVAPRACGKNRGPYDLIVFFRASLILSCQPAPAAR